MDKKAFPLKKKLTTITQLIEQEKQQGVPNGREAIEARYKAIDSIERLLDEVTKHFERNNKNTLSIEMMLQEPRGHLQQLARFLPSMKKVKRAANLLSFENLRILEIDEQHDEESDKYHIIRVVVMNNTGTVLFDRFVKPSQEITEETSHKTGVTTQDVEDAPTLPEIWKELLAVLSGGYVVSFNMLLDYWSFEEDAHRYQLEMPVLIGESLQELCDSYFHASLSSGVKEFHYSDLERFCLHIGSPLPEPPKQTALDRATGQLRILQAMAQGFIGKAEEDLAIQFSYSDERDFDEGEFERDESNEIFF